MSSRFALGALCIVGTVAIWAGWYVAIRFGLTATSLDVQDLAALRFGVAGLLLLPVIWRRGLALDRLGWPGVIAIALGGGAPFALLVGAGLVFAPVAHASALTQGTVYGAIALVAGRARGWLSSNPAASVAVARSVGVLMMLAAVLTVVGGWRSA